MNSKKMIKEFSFLKSYNFKIKKYERNGDIELIFSNGTLIIELSCFLNMFFNYSVEVIITHCGNRKNIFNCDFFNKGELTELKKNVFCDTTSCCAQIKQYADFIKNNIDILLEGK